MSDLRGLGDFEIKLFKDQLVLSHPDYTSRSIFKEDSVSYHFVVNALEDIERMREPIEKFKTITGADFVEIIEELQELKQKVEAIRKAALNEHSSSNDIINRIIRLTNE